MTFQYQPGEGSRQCSHDQGAVGGVQMGSRTQRCAPAWNCEMLSRRRQPLLDLGRVGVCSSQEHITYCTVEGGLESGRHVIVLWSVIRKMITSKCADTISKLIA